MKSKKTPKSKSILISTEQIEKEESNIYPENEDSLKCDEEINKVYSISNWSEMFYYGKSDLIKNRFLEFISKSEYAHFFEALNYEYGVNGQNKSITTAFSIYKEQANNSTDTLSMYKMYHIYKNEFQKFGLKKRNKILEKFYLFKCFAHLSRQEYQGYTLLLNRFHIVLDIKYYLEYEDPLLNKFDRFINHLNKYYNFYNINPDDIILINAFVTFIFKGDSNLAKSLLEPLIVKGNLQAVYQLALMLKEKNQIEGMFKYLEKCKYYRCYCDYALFLFKDMNNTQKALQILKEAISNGFIRANYLYYDIFLSTLDFSKIKDNESIKKDLLFIFNLLINNICLDEAFCYFEFFYLRKICNKHFNLKDFADKNFFEYEKNFVDILIQNSVPSPSEEDIKQKKELVKKLYIRNDYFCEFNLACGVIYYYGIENIVKPDLKKSLFKFQISFDNSDSESYKRFCYSYIARIKQKLFDLKDKDITKEDLDNSKKKLFELYSNSINIKTIFYLSASFFYYLYVLYIKKWGNPGDEIMEYICIKRASESVIKQPGTGTIISYYRKYKAQNIIKNEDKLIEKIKEIIKNKDNEGYGEDGSICPICFMNKRDNIFYPCKHRFCKICADKVMEESKCPICRGVVLINYDISKFNQ